MITSRCPTCGSLKDAAQLAREFREGAEGNCPSCQTHRNELREYAVKENNRIAEENEQRKARGDSELPFLDVSAVIRQGMHARGSLPSQGHADPRTGFQPGFHSTNVNNLGMGAKIPPGAQILRPGAPAPELPPE